MFRFILLVVFCIYPSLSFAMHHEFFEDDGGYQGQRVSDRGGASRFKFKSGESKKFRPHKPERYFQMMKRKLKGLDPASRDAALQEIDRHINSMSKILGNKKGFPDYVVKSRARSVRSPREGNVRQKTNLKQDSSNVQQDRKNDNVSGQSSQNVDQKKTYQKIRKRVKVV